ncbi:phage tail tape measure protein [Bradyrhizobium sp.]|uniref:phage tail tape measure protein n=1 Tax=Bradyrhizobium sp. TaxID=376 RepID=UPI0025B9669F|nr:phage tail tape measure protein [Bradyrhizobium sp.]
MSNPSVTATISANDLASPKLKELIATLKQAERLAKDVFDGTNTTGRYVAGMNAATAAAQKHVGVLHQIHAAHKAIAGTMLGYGALRVAHGGIDAVKDALPYLRKDREIAARSSYSGPDMELLRKQQRELATALGSTVEATQKAQEKFGLLGYKAGTNVALTKSTAIGARAMGVNAADNAELMETMISQFGIHADSVGDAMREGKRLNDIAAVATKKSNMTHEDVREYYKFSAAAAHSVGVSPEQSIAMGMALRRGGIPGSEAGVFARQFYARMMAPTRKGREMAAQVGINLDDYADHGPITGEGLSDKLKRGFGKGLSQSVIAAFNKDLEDNGEKILGDRGTFAEAVIKAREKHGGELSETDRKHIVRSANEYYDTTKTGIKGGALLDRIIAANNPMLMQQFLGDKQGARGNALVNASEYYFKAKDDQAHNAGFAQQISDELGKGLPAAVDALTATFQSAKNTMVQANEGWITSVVSGATSLTAAFSTLSPEVQKAVGIFAGVATVTAGGGAMVAFALSLRSLVVSANAASAALTTLAARGGVAGVAGAVPGPAGNAAKALGWRAGAGALGAVAAGPLGLIAGMTAAEVAWPYVDQWANGDDGIADGSPEDIARRRRFAFGPAWGNRSSAVNRITLGRDTSRNLGGTVLGAPGSGWQESASWGAIPASQGFGAGRLAEVTGTITGQAEVHQMLQLEVKPTAYFEGLIKRAENVANMSLNGRLGTSMQGPGDNGTKPSQGALTGTQ